MAIGGATISVEWGDEDHSISLTPKNWARVKSGKELRIRGKGYYYEGEFYWDYWRFGGGLHGQLTVNYGNGGDYSAVGFTGKLRDANITERIENRAETPIAKESNPSPEERKQQCFQILLKIRFPMAPDLDQE